MITDAIIRFVSGIIEFVVNLLPTAPVIAVGNGAASGLSCCAAFLFSSLNDAAATTVVVGGATVSVIQDITNSPLAVLLDWSLLGFFIGCATTILLAFLAIRVLLTFWMAAKL